MFCDRMHFKEGLNINPYLGFPLSVSRHTKAFVSFIMNKIMGKLAYWKAKFLSNLSPPALLQSLTTICNVFLCRSPSLGRLIVAWPSFCGVKIKTKEVFTFLVGK